MANLCENVLIVEGEASEVLRFQETFAGKLNGLGEDNYRFSNVVPENLPSGLDPSTCEDSEIIKAIVDRRLNLWGSQIDELYTPDVQWYEYEENGFASVCLEFFTKWSPPTSFCMNASENFPNLQFILRFVETGVGFMGEAIYENGYALKLISVDITDEHYREAGASFDETGEIDYETWEGTLFDLFPLD